MLRLPVRLPIRLSDLPETCEIAAWLSVPPGAQTLLILVHGGFYTHAYWDLPYRPETYSCVQWAGEQGLATLNIDRLGAGDSSAPPAALVDTPRNAEALHQLVQLAKTTGVAGHAFARCVVVGHSLGSFIAGLMQADFGGADALVLTGVLGVNASRIADTPQALEAFLARSAPGPSAGYRTMPAHRRAKSFFHIPPAEQALIDVDARLAGVMTTAESGTMGLAADACARVTAPVLVQVGAFDRFYYNPERESDAARLYARARDMAPANFSFAALIPDAGHNLALHPNARETYQAMADWLTAALA